MQNKKLIVSSSPHIGSKLTTQRIMFNVIIALMAPLIAGVIFYGFYAFLVALISVVSAVAAEALFNVIVKKKQTIKDLSAVVTGLILALNLPPRIPLYVPVVGAIFAIMVVKMLFGGLGKNFANPAAAARIFLMLSWASAMSKYIAPLDYSSGFFKAFFGFNTDLVTSATPLVEMKNLSVANLNLLDMFLGRIGGSIGETCTLAIIIGGLYLLVTKIIDWRIPVVYIVSSVLLSWLFYGSYTYILPTLLSGGLMLAAFFMLTDYASSPIARLGRIIFALGAAFFTVLVRRYGSFNEGASLAILFMNLLVPLIDKLTKPKPYGYVKPPKTKREVNK